MSNEQHKNNSRTVFAFVLIAVGIFWTLRQLGVYYEFPQFILENVFYPMRQVLYRFSHFIFFVAYDFDNYRGCITCRKTFYWLGFSNCWRNIYPSKTILYSWNYNFFVISGLITWNWSGDGCP